MKKIKLNGKLSLNKETISKLNDEQMNKVQGGDIDWPTWNDHCWDSGGTTFNAKCEWCGWLHSTDWKAEVAPRKIAAENGKS
jgi:natural product precursor